jgi:hypothetical protein
MDEASECTITIKDIEGYEMEYDIPIPTKLAKAMLDTAMRSGKTWVEFAVSDLLININNPRILSIEIEDN